MEFYYVKAASGDYVVCVPADYPRAETSRSYWIVPGTYQDD